MAITKVKVVLAKPMSERQTACITKATDRGILLSYLVTSHPEKGSPIKELMGIANRIVPSSASLKSKAVLIVGILDAQLEKLKPERKKNTLRKILCLFFKSIIVKNESANIPLYGNNWMWLTKKLCNSVLLF